jgi:hypothetical protein
VETGIPPNEWLDAPDGILEATYAYLNEKNRKREQ